MPRDHDAILLESTRVHRERLTAAFLHGEMATRRPLDVVAGEWYAPYVKWAASKGIVNGYGDGTFGVDDEVTIEQAVVILARYAEYCAVNTSSEKSLSRYAD